MSYPYEHHAYYSKVRYGSFCFITSDLAGSRGRFSLGHQGNEDHFKDPSGDHTELKKRMLELYASKLFHRAPLDAVVMFTPERTPNVS